MSQRQQRQKDWAKDREGARDKAREESSHRKRAHVKTEREQIRPALEALRLLKSTPLQSGAIRDHLVAWYMTIFKQQIYDIEIRTHPGNFFWDEQQGKSVDNEGLGSFEGDLYALFTLYNMLPTLGVQPSFIFIPQVIVYTDTYHEAFKSRVNSFDLVGHLSPEYAYKVIIFNGSMTAKWTQARTILKKTEYTKIFGLFSGKYFDDGVRAGHACAYVIDLSTDTFEIFDVNGSDCGNFTPILNILQDALEFADFKPMEPTPIISSLTGEYYGLKDGYINPYEIDHPGLCAYWSVTYLWLRATNSRKVVHKFFNFLGQTQIDRLTPLDFNEDGPIGTATAFAGRLFHCVRSVFGECINEYFFKGIYALDEEPLDHLLKASYQDYYATIDFRHDDGQQTLISLLRVVFGCHPNPDDLRELMNTCVPGNSIPQLFADTNIKLPWVEFQFRKMRRKEQL